MKMPRLFATWNGTRSANYWLSVSVGGLVLMNLMLTFKVVSMHERLVEQPPNMTAEYSVGWDSASSNFYEAWGLYVASAVGSVTPQTAHFVADHLAFIVDASIYPAVRDQIYAIADDPAYVSSGSLNVFVPRSSKWEASTHRVFIEGTLNTTAYKTTAQPLAQLPVTYELTMKMVAGLPRITAFTSYVGEARTLQWQKAHPPTTGVASGHDRLHPNIVPQANDIRHALESGQGRINPADNTAIPSTAPATPARGARALTGSATGVAQPAAVGSQSPGNGGTEGIAGPLPALPVDPAQRDNANTASGRL